jgi:hypothetical protein
MNWMLALFNILSKDTLLPTTLYRVFVLTFILTHQLYRVEIKRPSEQPLESCDTHYSSDRKVVVSE